MPSARLLLASLALAAAATAGCGSEGDGERTSAVGAVAAVTPADAAGTKAQDRPRGQVSDDAEAAESFPSDPGQLTERAPSPKAAKPAEPVSAAEGVSPGAPSDEQVAAELEEMDRVLKEQEKVNGSGKVGRATLNRDGTASPPPGAPLAVRRIINAGNAIAKFPYVYGGGHGSFVDTAYDCSGSVSYALAGAGLVKAPMVSGAFMTAGEEGPGKWVTIYAHEGHMYMEVAGLRFDTSGRGGPLGSRWQVDRRSSKGFEVRHPPGL